MLQSDQFGKTAVDIVKEHAAGPARGMARNVKRPPLDFAGLGAAADLKTQPYFTWDQAHREGDGR